MPVSRRLPHVAVAVLAALLAVLVPATPPPARAADDFRVEVTPTSGLADSDTVSVDVEGIPDGQGIYLMLCIDVAGRASGDQCSEDHQAWITPTGYPGTQHPDDSPFDFAVDVTFGDHDCRVETCGVQTRRDHFDGSDTSMDTFTALSFASGEEATEDPTLLPTPAATDEPTAEPTPTPTDDGPFRVVVSPTAGLADQDTVRVEVRGLRDDQGVYIQLCAAEPDGGRATGARCEDEGEFGGGVWVVEDYPYPGEEPEGVVHPSDGPFALDVSRTFNEVDCGIVACGIQTRRDHRAGGDTSLDTFTPIAFASAPSDVATPDAAVDAAAETLPATGGDARGLMIGGLLALAAGALLAGHRRRAATGDA